MTQYRHPEENAWHSPQTHLGSYIRNSYRVRRWVGAAALIWAIALVVLLLPLSVAAEALPQAASTPTPSATSMPIEGVAGRGGVALWAEDGVSGGKVAQGALLTVQARSSDDAWLYVVSDSGGVATDGPAGWAAAESVIILDSSVLPAQDVSITPATPEPETTASRKADDAETAPEADGAPTMVRIVLDGGRLNIRKGPGTDYPVVAKALPGDVYPLLGESDDSNWYEIALGDDDVEHGWVSAKYAVIDDGSHATSVAKTVVPSDASQAANQPTTDAHQSATGYSGQLVIQESWGGNIHLYNLDTGDLRLLTTGFDPSLSPNGSKVAFTRGGGENGVYVYDLATNTEAKVFGGRELLRSPKWSPEGQFIAFEQGDDYILCKDEPSRCGLSAPSPDGTFPELERQPSLARVTADGSSYEDLPVLPYAGNPDWSQAGIVYQSLGGIQITGDEPDADTELVYFDIQKQYELDPDWQRNGGTIVFQQRELNHWELFAVQPDGGGLRALTHPPSVFADSFPNNVAPAWSPDGQHIVFLSNRAADGSAGEWAVWVMDADGGGLTRLPIELPFEYTYVGEQMVDWGPSTR